MTAVRIYYVQLFVLFN